MGRIDWTIIACYAAIVAICFIGIFASSYPRPFPH